jgi:hypothetical protein
MRQKAQRLQRLSRIGCMHGSRSYFLLKSPRGMLQLKSSKKQRFLGWESAKLR